MRLIATVLAILSTAPAHHTRRHHKAYPHMRPAVASWFDDAESTACGTHFTFGFAHKTLPCGAKVRFCYRRCVVGIREDAGPFVAGRDFDLNPTLRSALGCTDICHLRWARVG